MKKIIRFSNTATAFSDVMCLQLAKSIVKELLEDKNLDVEFSYSNQVFLDCIRAELIKTDKTLVNKISWRVEDIEVKIYQSMGSNDIWRLLPNISEEALEIILSNR